MNGEHESATRLGDAEGRQYHIGLAPGEVAERIVLVGDPARAEKVARRFDAVELERRHREYVTFTGRHEGRRVTVMATGMGPDNTEIALVELCQCVTAPVLIRCGSTGALQPWIALGDLVVSQAAYRLETTSLYFVGEGYPAVAHPEVVLALVRAASERGHPHHVGITATAPGFYGAQSRDLPGFPLRDPDLVSRLECQGILNVEMEMSCLLTLASLRGLRAGGVCAVFANRPGDTFVDAELKASAEERCIDVALDAFAALAELDRQRGELPLWHPGLAGR